LANTFSHTLRGSAPHTHPLRGHAMPWPNARKQPEIRGEMKKAFLIFTFILFGILSIAFADGWLPKLYMGPADTIGGWQSGDLFLMESPDSGVMFIASEGIRVASTRPSIIRFGQIVKDAVVWEDTFTLDFTEHSGLVTLIPYIIGRRPGFAEPGDTVYYSYGYNYSYMFAYTGTTLVYEPTDCTTDADTCYMAYIDERGMIVMDDGIWLTTSMDNIFSPSAIMLQRFQFTPEPDFVCDSMIIINSPLWGPWALVHTPVINKGLGDTTFHILMQAMPYPPSYPAQVFEAKILDGGDVVWDTMGTIRDYPDSLFHNSLNGIPAAFVDGYVLHDGTVFRGPYVEVDTYFVVYREPSGDRTFQFFDRDLVYHNTCTNIGFNDTVGLVAFKHRTSSELPDSTYCAIGIPGSLVYFPANEAHHHNATCAFDIEGNFYVVCAGYDGTWEPYVKCFVTDSTVSGVEETKTPDRYKINVYPNPFNSSCIIEAPLGTKKITIYDILGNKISDQKPIANKFNWQGIDNMGKKVPNGIYLITTKSGEDEDVISKKVILLK